MEKIKERLIRLADSLDNRGHMLEADKLDSVIQRLATPLETTDKEKVDAIKDRYDLIGEIELMHKRFAREISEPHYSYLGSDIIENAKQKFDQLANILEQGKMKQSDIAGQELV